MQGENSNQADRSKTSESVSDDDPHKVEKLANAGQDDGAVDEAEAE